MKKKIFVLLLSVFLFSAITVHAETYNGEYSVEYLLRNYNYVAFGNYDGKGFFSNKNNNIEGAVLINGEFANNFTTPANSSIGSNSGGIKSYIKGPIADTITVTGAVLTNTDYLDFDKLYTNVMSESKYLADSATDYITSKNIEITNPGNYVIQNTSVFQCDEATFSYLNNNYCNYNSILIKNYDKNGLYIFNYYNDQVNFLPTINLLLSGSSNVVSLKDYINSGEYTGNIIFNFPNAKFINLSYSSFANIYLPGNDISNIGFSGHIIAPNAGVRLLCNYYSYTSGIGYSYYYGSIIADQLSISSGVVTLKKANYSLSNKLYNGNISYVSIPKDYDDDFYSRDYSISDLLQNYSLITLGHKALDSKSKLLQFGNKPGSVKLFHITGQALINGDLYGKVYEDQNDDFYNGYHKFDRTIFDLESNKVTESYIDGNVFQAVPSNGALANVILTVIQPWDNMANDNYRYLYQKNNLIINSNNTVYNSSTNGPGNVTMAEANYINFNRLYDNVVAEQSAIAGGKKVTAGSDGVLHISIGGFYTIDDINGVNEIVFDNFEENKDKLTIITVKNSGDVNFPWISKDTGGYKGIVTNDYFGKTQATHFYEQDTFVQDSYYGNIVWNVPNATFIELKENAPFAGHLIAPNADVNTPELHFAGCFIVNSIYGEGNTEAHFYPITVEIDCDCQEYDGLPDDMKKKFSDFRLDKMLGGDSSIVDTEIVGDEGAYQEEINTLEHVLSRCPSNDIYGSNPGALSNPQTYRNFGIVILIIITIGCGVVVYRKKKVFKR